MVCCCARRSALATSAEVHNQLIQALDLDLPQHAHCGIATDQPASRSTAASSASPTTSTPSTRVHRIAIAQTEQGVHQAAVTHQQHCPETAQGFSRHAWPQLGDVALQVRAEELPPRIQSVSRASASSSRGCRPPNNMPCRHCKEDQGVAVNGGPPGAGKTAGASRGQAPCLRLGAQARPPAG